MANVYMQFADWQKIYQSIPNEKFFEIGRMTSKQASAFGRDVKVARILFKNEQRHVIELQIDNIYYTRTGHIFDWVRAVFQTMPYDNIVVLNCRNRYYLFMRADMKDRENKSSVNTEKTVAHIYGTDWIDDLDFKKSELKAYDVEGISYRDTTTA